MRAVQIGPVTQIEQCRDDHFERPGVKEIRLKFVNEVSEQHSTDQNIRQLVMRTHDPEDAKIDRPDKKFIRAEMSAEEIYTALAKRLVTKSQANKPQLDEKYFKLYYTVQQKNHFEPGEDYDYSYKLFVPRAFQSAENTYVELTLEVFKVEGNPNEHVIGISYIKGNKVMFHSHVNSLTGDDSKRG